MIGEAQAGVGAVDPATATAVDPATATAVDPATATAVDPATATAAPVLLYRQWWPFGYRQPPVEGNPALTAGRAQTARGSMEPRGRPAAYWQAQHASGVGCVRPAGGIRIVPEQRQPTACQPSNRWTSSPARVWGQRSRRARLSDSETLRPAATNTLRSISHLARLPASTVQSHPTHVYTKLGLTSRVQLVQEAARHA
jgi:hypothetical protein